MTEAFIYLRVSTPRQKEQGVSLGSDDDPGFQEQKCREFCKLRGWEVVSVERDAASGRSMRKRDGLARQVAAARKAKGVAVVYAVARLGRSVQLLHNLLADLEACGASFASATESIDTSTAMGRAFFGLLAIFAQLESDQISERVKAAFAHIRKTKGGRTHGVAKYGWTLNHETGELIENPAEQRVISYIVLCRNMKPRPTWATITEALNARGWTTRKGLAWNHAGTKQLGERFVREWKKQQAARERAARKGRNAG